MKTKLFIARLISIMLVIVLLAGGKLPAQEITTYQYRYVAPDKVDEFIKRETTYWSKVAKKAIDNGKLSFWGLFERIGGTNLQNEANFLFINTYPNIDSAGSVWNPAAVFPKTPIAQMEDWSFSKNTSELFLADRNWEEAAGVKPDKEFNYVAIFYHNSSNPDSFINAEKKVWAPFIKASMDKNLTKQRGWGNAVVLSPQGSSMKFNSVSFDLFSSLKDVLLQQWETSAQFPSAEAFAELDKLRLNPPSREIYRVVKVESKPPAK